MGGLPEMVEHRVTGYVAEFKSAADLAKGIRFVLSEAKASVLRTQSRAKALREYSEEVVSTRYYQLYAAAAGEELEMTN
jgi:glycosyltransferase involved in cell wall biosynthesis